MPAFIADPVVVDEFWPLGAVCGPSGLRAEEPLSRPFAAGGRPPRRPRVGRAYEKANFIVVHMGGGISIGAHRKGRVVDVNDALDGDGPFSPERSGSLPTGPLVALCFSGKHTHDEVWKMLVGHGGMFAYLGTNDCREVEAADPPRRRQGPRSLRGDGLPDRQVGGGVGGGAVGQGRRPWCSPAAWRGRRC